ncbi:MAG: ABC transporter substrate-binding protein, partial [Verrucomicrobiota bacterium]
MDVPDAADPGPPALPARAWRAPSHRLLARAALLAGVLLLLPVSRPAQADAWDEVRARGALRWGNDAEGGQPYIFTDPARPDVLTGFEVDFAGALCARLGLQSRFVQNNWDLLVPALRQGGSFEVIIAGLERTPANLAKVDLSRPYFAFGQQLVARADDPRVAGPESLRGRSVGVLSATASHRLAETWPGVEVRVYPDNVNYFRDLEVGRIDAVLADSPIARVHTAGNPRLRLAGPSFAPGFYSVAVNPGETNLLARIDEAIAGLVADGTLQRIYAKYDLWDAGQAALAG